MGCRDKEWPDKEWPDKEWPDKEWADVQSRRAAAAAGARPWIAHYDNI